LVRVLDNDDNPSENVTVSLEVDYISTQATNEAPNCDSDARDFLVGTLEYIRLSQVCRVLFKNNTILTNDLGQAAFSNLIIEMYLCVFYCNRGPQGVYELKASTSEKISTHTIKVMMTSPAYSIKILDDSDKMRRITTANVSQTLPDMPTIQVFDSDGNPLPDKRVVAFAWPEPEFNPQYPSTAFVDALKYAYFNNSISPPTDSEGKTTFKDLTVLGYTSQYGTYLHFSVDGIVTMPYIEDLKINKRLAAPPHMYHPLILKTQVARVVVVVKPPSIVVEGEPFADQPVIRILDQFNNPLSGKMVFAIKVGSRRQIFPANYAMKTVGSAKKDLIYPIPGEYKDDFMNPMHSHEFVPILTNSSGYVNFTNLSFSLNGIAGKNVEALQTIAFVCDGVESERFDIWVDSKVASLSFLEAPPTIVNINMASETHLMLSILITGANGKGIRGKTPREIILAPVDSKYANNIKGFMDTENADFEPSAEDGIFKLPYRITKMQRIDEEGTLSIIARLKIEIDDSILITPDIEFTIDLDQGDGGCTDIEMLNFASGIIDIVFLLMKIIQ